MNVGKSCQKVNAVIDQQGRLARQLSCPWNQDYVVVSAAKVVSRLDLFTGYSPALLNRLAWENLSMNLVKFELSHGDKHW